MTQPLNVLFITADQWRADCLSAAGHPMVKTPNLDALAAEGVRFARHFASAAPCGPSRACLHTGLYLHNHRSAMNGTPLDARHANWAQEAAAIGYDPVLFGYTDTSLDPRTLPEGDPWLSTYEGPLPGIRPEILLIGAPTPWLNWLAAKGYEIPDDHRRGYAWRRPGPDWEDGAPHPRPLFWPAEVDETAFLSQGAMDYMRAAKDPFALHLSFLRPHPPYVAPTPWNALYDPAATPPPSRRESRQLEGALHPLLEWMVGKPGFRAPANEKVERRREAVYFGLISRVDDELGRIVAFLKETGLWDRTLIILTSDHGEQLGDHWLWDKGGWFEQSYRVPLVIHDPRPSADPGRGRVVEAFTESVDVAPSLLGAIGAKVPHTMDGFDLAPFLRGEAAPPSWRAEAHFEYDFRDAADDEAERALGVTLHQCALAAIRADRWKYVHFAALPPLLFDLENDPGEFVNLADDPAFASVALSMAQKLLSWRLTHEDQTLTHISLTDAGPVSRPSPRYREGHMTP